MRLALLSVAALAACSSDLGGVRRDAATADAGLDADRPGRDSGSEADAGPADGAIGTDAGGPADADPGCTPTHPECRGELECGAVPNGCPGGTIDCGECGGGELYCAVLDAPRWRARVSPCVQSVQDAHPEYFDPVLFRDTSSWLVLDPSAVDYVRDVAACVDGSGAIAIPDPNAPGNEIRARGTDDDVADNYIVRTYGTGRTAGRYTSSCTPAMF